MKDYGKLFQLFYGNYTPQYCEQNKLFISYKTDGSVRYLTKSLVDYAYEILATDLNMIFGHDFKIITSNENNQPVLDALLQRTEFDKTARLFVMQGLILGDSALRVGRDAAGTVRLGIVNLMVESLQYVLNNGEIEQWTVEYPITIDGKSVIRNEIYTKSEVVITEDGVVVNTIPNRYREFWIKHVANTPSLKDPVFGDSELERIGDTLDEMNSTLSRIAAIEDIYADPRLIVTGLHDISALKKEYNIWSIPDSANVKILEYSGNIIPAMLAKYDKLENYLRNKCPELILNDLGNISGYALKLKLSKLIKKIDNYRAVYFAGIKQALELALKMEGVVNPELTINASPVIPADEVEDMQKWTQLLAMDVVSRETVAKALGFDFEEEQKKIDAESAWLEGLNSDQ